MRADYLFRASMDFRCFCEFVFLPVNSYFFPSFAIGKPDETKKERKKIGKPELRAALADARAGKQEA
jgi:hypothetical protein